MKTLMTVFLFVATAFAGMKHNIGLDGNIRSLAADQQGNILAGTSDGDIFLSNDAGYHWQVVGHYSRYVVDRVAFVGDTAYAVLWSPYGEQYGYLVRSTDLEHWSISLALRPIRAFAGTPGNLIVGSLDGIYHSTDGTKWDKIGDFSQVDTVALDGDAVYVGTWHLPYKTTDLGKNWHRINRGMLDDSDVFSILPFGKTVYASACTGVYMSTDGGESFERLRTGRTRVLRSAGAAILAGTTDGVWKTLDGGRKWERDSQPGIVVNDILLIPDGFLLATETGLVIHAGN